MFSTSTYSATWKSGKARLKDKQIAWSPPQQQKDFQMCSSTKKRKKVPWSSKENSADSLRWLNKDDPSTHGKSRSQPPSTDEVTQSFPASKLSCRLSLQHCYLLSRPQTQVARSWIWPFWRKGEVFLCRKWSKTKQEVPSLVLQSI